MVNNLNNEIFVFYLADCNCAEIVQRTHSTHALCKIHIILNLLMNGVYNPISIPPVLILPYPMGRRLLGMHKRSEDERAAYKTLHFF